jgi:hypothetical protein
MDVVAVKGVVHIDQVQLDTEPYGAAMEEEPSGHRDVFSGRAFSCPYLINLFKH